MQPFAAQHPQRVLITGSTNELGSIFAELFAENGYGLVLVSDMPQCLEEQSAFISTRYGVPVHPISCDLSDPWMPEEIVETLNRRRLSVDILVNNAGSGEHGPFLETNLGRELKLIETHITNTTSLTKRLLPAMVRRGRGKILNVVAAVGRHSSPDRAVHRATGAYVSSLSETLSAELTGSGVTVTALISCTSDGITAPAGVSDDAKIVDIRSLAMIGYAGLMKGETRAVSNGYIKA